MVAISTARFPCMVVDTCHDYMHSTGRKMSDTILDFAQHLCSIVKEQIVMIARGRLGSGLF